MWHKFCLFKDHPRLCGEKTATSQLVDEIVGSPPPMRGKVQPANVDFFEDGITPAYAGKRSNPRRPVPLVRDHPRLCGEKNCRTRRSSSGGGSPPPMRGKGLDSCVHVLRAGITPAYAGKSPIEDAYFHQSQDHPRLCGEKSAGISRPRVT